MAYSALDYAGMLGDPARMNAYCGALKRAVFPGATVLDLGTGTGYFAVLACLYGAKHVYAIDPNQAIEVGKVLAKANGVADRITWYQKDSTEVNLPQPADVLISDLRGLLPQNPSHLEAITDARTRLLKPGGTLMPQRDHLWIAPVNDEESFLDLLQPWHPVDLAPVKMESYSSALGNSFVSRMTYSKNLLAEGQKWTEIDYRTVTTFKHRNTVEFKIQRSEVGHGFNLWFDAEIDDEFGFSFGPDRQSHVYGSTFFPWPEPLNLEAGDRLVIDVSTHETPSGIGWTWLTRHYSQDSTNASSHYRQSTLLDLEQTSKPQLARQRPDYQPVLSDEGMSMARIFELLKVGLTLQKVADTVAAEFPNQNKSNQEWLQTVAEISLRYT